MTAQSKLQPGMRDPRKIYVANFGSDTETTYKATNKALQTGPTITNLGVPNGGPLGVAVDANSKIYVLTSQGLTTYGPYGNLRHRRSQAISTA